ncbi:hypothetical protein N8160_03600 [Pelagibacteraceae bacterium]|jgi:hypothetical protein|nr:hypothetical protein [Pelagibacteraceae bacterium]
MSDELKTLAIEALTIQKRIKNDTNNLKIIKDQLIEKSKTKNSSYNINVEDGNIRIIKCKKLIYYKLNEKGFSKLDNQTKNDLLKKKLLKVKFDVNNDNYNDALNNNLVPNTLKELMEKRERQPFYVSVYTDIKKNISSKPDDNNDLDDEDSENDETIDFTNNDPKDLSEIEKQEKGIE